MRGATFVAVQDSTLAQISIHAPVRGATSDRSLKSFTISHFNPRSREGSDSRLPINAYNLIWFQSTLPWGERLYAFQRLVLLKTISIHAPVRGATAPVTSCKRSKQISIHAPVRGATISKFYSLMLPRISIHAPVRGATGCYLLIWFLLEFQSTLPWGERPWSEC